MEFHRERIREDDIGLTWLMLSSVDCVDWRETSLARCCCAISVIDTITTAEMLFIRLRVHALLRDPSYPLAGSRTGRGLNIGGERRPILSGLGKRCKRDSLSLLLRYWQISRDLQRGPRRDVNRLARPCMCGRGAVQLGSLSRSMLLSLAF